MSGFIDLLGQRLGDLEIIGRASNDGKKVRWHCICSCGREVIRRTSDLVRRDNVCRCETRPYIERHGRSYDPAIQTWWGMHARCYNKNDVNYPNWGGRGITVCEEWHDANTFCDWAHENGYQRGLTIERKDVNGNYCPENCCWITRGDQGKNQRTTHWITFAGETMCLSDAARMAGISRPGLQKRLKRGWSVERALTEPTR